MIADADVLRSLPDIGIAVLDRDGTITAWNPAAVTLTGFPEAEAVGSDVAWLDQAGDAGTGRLERAEREATTTLSARRRKDGSDYWCAATLAAIHDEGGRLVGFVEAFRDATGEHEELTELRTVRDRFERALKAARIVISTQDLDLRYTWAYRAPVEPGYEVNEAIGRTDLELLPEPLATVVTEAKRRVLEQETGTRLDVVVPVADSSERVYDLIIEPLLDEHGRVGGVSSASIDVTEQRQVEHDLRQSEARLAEAETIARMGSWEWDIVRNEVSRSDGLLAIYGIARGAAPGGYEPHSERVHPDDRDRVDAVLQRASTAGDPFEIDFRIIRPDGRIRRLQSRGEVIADEYGTPIRLAGTILDVTDSRAVEHALLHTADELAQRAIELQRLASGSHDSATASLSARQREVLTLIAEGLVNTEIASRLFLSESTVKWHVRQILHTLGVTTRAQAVARYYGHTR
jgi:PAS domain S-box-containing protein